MKRLTHKARYEAGYKLNRGVKEWQAVDRLGAYENTGLTPEQVREAREKQTPKTLEFFGGCEGGDYEDGELLCPNCQEECGFSNCPYCGQAIEQGRDGNER